MPAHQADANMKELPQYQSHKKVWAVKILEIKQDPYSGQYLIISVEQGYGPIPVDKRYIDHHKPQPGGYYVVYEDGYRSFSPAHAFEKGHVKL